MNNYFYAELKKALSVNDTDNTTNTQCEIDHVELEQNHITLKCGHKFNYIAIFNSIKEHKQHKGYSKSNLNTEQMKCPYCRNIQNKILPYYKNILNEKIYGVNFPEEFTMTNNICDHKFKSGKVCDKKCYFEKCNTHLKSDKNKPLFNNNTIDYKNLKSYTVIMLRTIAKFNKCNKYSKLNKNDLITTILDKYNE